MSTVEVPKELLLELARAVVDAPSKERRLGLGVFDNVCCYYGAAIDHEKNCVVRKAHKVLKD